MIKLTRLDRQEIALNCDRIVWVESCPDTTVRLEGGESILVRESQDEVIRRVAAFRSLVLREASLPAPPSVESPRPALPRDPSPQEEDIVILDRDTIAVVEVSP